DLVRVVADPFGYLRSGHAVRDSLDVEQRAPDLAHRRIHGEGILELHRYLRRCRRPTAIASVTASSARRLWPLRNSSHEGSAAAMPPERGANSRLAFRGLTQTIRWAIRRSRPTSRSTRAGSPHSHPSERMTTTAPRANPRRPYPSLKRCRASPIRVPPDQSLAAAAARSIARSGWRFLSARVSSVKRVANTNDSAFGPPTRAS